MQNAAITALGLDAVYVAIRTDHGAVPHMVQAFEAAGIAGNVTVPHKIEVARLFIRVTSLAKEVGAVNTFWPEGGRLIGDNTDVHGVLGAVDRIEGEDPWLLLGTGGSARAVAAAARERDATLIVRSRREDRARDFAAWARELGVTEAVPDDGRTVGTVINATPLGLAPDDPLPVSAERLAGCRAALDLAYARGSTRWIRSCRKLGMVAMDGRVVLVAQGAKAFERFFPESTAPVEVMAAAVERTLDQ
jgi:shikimate dehydrogenase